MTRACPEIGLVVPCFNEERMLPITAQRLQDEWKTLIAEGLIDPDSRIYFVDDGSSDSTWQQIADLVRGGGPFVGIKLTRNFGHQYALYAGLMEASGDALVSIDADLQDDVSVIRKMIGAFVAGDEIVYGVRDDRSSDTAFKRHSARAYYWFSEKLGTGSIRNHADYRLMSRRALGLLGQYRESNLYLRGIVPLLGLRSSMVHFRRSERVAGDSKYGLRKMLSLSLKGLTSFSIMPLRLISAIGVVIFIASILMGVWAFWVALYYPDATPGWASTVIPIYLLGGLQLLCIGVAGEYIGKTYMEVKNRPLYLIEEIRGAPEVASRESGPDPQ